MNRAANPLAAVATSLAGPRPFLTAFAALLLWAAPSFAQNSQITLEGSFVRGALGYARQLQRGWLAGVEAGFGFPQLDRTLAPEQDSEGSPDFEEYLHIGVFARAAGSEHLDIDMGIRGSIADLYPCDASDCWPSLFAGGYLQVMAGWRRLKFGPRLTAGWVHESDSRSDGWTWVVGLNPFAVRYTFSW